MLARHIVHETTPLYLRKLHLCWGVVHLSTQIASEDIIRAKSNDEVISSIGQQR